MTDAWTTIRYRNGFGSDLTVELTLSADRYARLVRSNALASTEYVGRLEAWVLPELRSYLCDAGFPSLPKDPAGAYKGLFLSVAGEGHLSQAWISLVHSERASIGQAVLLLERVMSALADTNRSAYGASGRPILAH